MKIELENCFARWLAQCGGVALPPAPWSPRIESFIWSGAPTPSKWCRWRPQPKTRISDIAAAAPDLPPLHASIHRWFNSWWFCALEGQVGDNMLILEPVAPGIELDRFILQARAYARAHDGRLDRVPLGIESESSLQVVVDNRTGSVGIEDWERGTVVEIASSLEAMLDRMYCSEPTA